MGKHDYLSRIQCARFKGTERVHFIDKKDFNGPLLTQIDGAYQFVLGHINMAVEINGITHDEIYEIPAQAIREIIVNAAVHRNYMIASSIQVAVYDDRVEISSPGGLYGSLTLEEALSGRSSIRNKIIASVLEKLNVIEGWGTGLKRIISICKENKTLAPKFEEIGDMLRVSIYRHKINKSGDKNGDKSGDKTSTINEKIIDYVTKYSPAKTADIADFIGLKLSRTKVYISKLVSSGAIIASGANKKRVYLSPQTTKTAITNFSGNKTAITEQILFFLSKNSPATAEDIALFLGQEKKQTKKYLSKLLKDEKIVAIGSFKNRTYMLKQPIETP